jgi:hypothetical protein
MNASTQSCTCPEEGYTPHCPYAFFQGGQMLHEVKGDGRLKTRFEVIQMNSDRKSNSASTSSNDGFETIDQQRVLIAEFERQHYPDQYKRNDSGNSEGSDDLYEEVTRKVTSQTGRMTINDERMKQSNIVDAEDMLANNRDMLRKYEPLRIGKNALTEMSIGGFTIDLGKAAQKASEVVPLPPARLPKIFIDPEMNFNHHFFQGLERLIGREQVLDIVKKRRYYTNEDLVLLPLIEGIVKAGYEKKDTNLTVFTKSVLSSTFELDERMSVDSPHRGLLVAANLWGFQYIEAGMECKEADLRMWLRICYNKFENIFFNTFKDSGMPDFALEGVQARYEPVQKYQPIGPEQAAALNEHQELVRRNSFEDFDDSQSVRITRTHRRRRNRKPEPSIGSLLFGSRR